MLLSTIATFLIIPSALGTSELQGGSESACPRPWVDGTLLGLGCLLFNSTETYTWEGASVYCQGEENATLVEIWTETQLDFIRMELQMISEVETSKDWWTAGTDVGREGKWNWATSSAAVGDFIWADSNPDGGFSDNCLDLCDTCGSTGFMGSDWDCSRSACPICQKFD